MNSRFSGFAIRCNGPLCHRHILLERNLESFGRRKSDLATRGIQSRSTCLANMEYHMRSKIAQTVCPDLAPGWSMIYNHQILKASDPLYFPLRTPDTLSSLLIKWLRVKDSNLRLLGYEPSGLTTDVTRDNFIGALCPSRTEPAKLLIFLALLVLSRIE